MANRATAEGTLRYKNRFEKKLSLDHFREWNTWQISSIGMGTYLGEPDRQTDHAYAESVRAALESGCNLFDTAINYRFQRSERNIGSALQKAINSGNIQRDEVVLTTKGGFVSLDGEMANPQRYFEEEFVQTGVADSADLVAGCHCMSPPYMANQVERSLANLQVECIDIYLIHNPETQLAEISRQDFLKRMLAAFKVLERKVSDGKIQCYGTATWNGYREQPGSRGYLSLEELIGLARVAGGEDHHFRAIQLPYNLGMPEAALRKNQKFGSESVSALEAASRYGMMVLASASILQGQLSKGLPAGLRDLFSGLQTDAQRSIQFVRSTPGVTSALVGMSNIRHVAENLQLAEFPAMKPQEMNQLLSGPQ